MKPARRPPYLLGAALLSLALLPPLAHGEVVLIANSRSGIDKLTREEAINIFMGRYRKLPDGLAAHPLDLEVNSPIRRQFYRGLIDKTPEEIHAYWMRLVFAGRTTPPLTTKGVEEMLEMVAGDPQAIGYVERSELARIENGPLARNIKIVLTLPELTAP